MFEAIPRYWDLEINPGPFYLLRFSVWLTMLLIAFVSCESVLHL